MILTLRTSSHFDSGACALMCAWRIFAIGDICSISRSSLYLSATTSACFLVSRGTTSFVRRLSSFFNFTAPCAAPPERATACAICKSSTSIRFAREAAAALMSPMERDCGGTYPVCRTSTISLVSALRMTSSRKSMPREFCAMRRRYSFGVRCERSLASAGSPSDMLPCRIMVMIDATSAESWFCMKILFEHSRCNGFFPSSSR
mmetsp:Transcript_43038/g.116055  ORF Transcript_43038/g.116055 Transcript_43038/m.116055 type:complete len:204 (-) Transcript_43038:1132-1743(-)